MTHHRQEAAALVTAIIYLHIIILCGIITGQEVAAIKSKRIKKGHRLTSLIFLDAMAIVIPWHMFMDS